MHITVAGLLLAACVTESSKRTDKLELAASVQGVAVPDGVSAGPLVLSAPPEPDLRLSDPQDPQGDRAGLEARLRTQFGSSVLIGVDGRVTKNYFLAGDLGPTFLKLVAEIAPQQLQPPPTASDPPPGTKVGGPNSRSILGRMLGGREVEIAYLKDFEVVGSSALASPNALTGAQLASDPNPPKVALVLVTGEPSALAAFEGAFDLFYSSIPQIEISVQVIEYNTANALAFGVKTNLLNANLANLDSGQLIQGYTSGFPLRPPFVGSTAVTDSGLFKLGGIHDSWKLDATLAALEANNLADITSSPKLVVRNGGIAAISTLTMIPFPKARFAQNTSLATDIEFKPVGVKMNIIPVIAGTDSVLLQIYADVSAVTSFANTEPVVTPITSQRTAVTTVYLKNQHSLLIGGLKTVSQIESETKVPILGDIPVIGWLFRSTSSSRQETSVAFQITPRIVTDRGQAPDRGQNL